MTKHAATSHAKPATRSPTSADDDATKTAADEQQPKAKPTDDVRVHPFAEDQTTRLAPDSGV